MHVRYYNLVNSEISEIIYPNILIVDELLHADL